MLYDLALRTKMGSKVEMMIPHVGIFMQRNKIVAVAFDDNLLSQAKVFILLYKRVMFIKEIHELKQKNYPGL
jgi:hypothetical protein